MALKRIKVDDAKSIRDDAVRLERKLIALWLKQVLTKKQIDLIQSGEYKRHLANGMLAEKGVLILEGSFRLSI